MSTGWCNLFQLHSIPHFGRWALVRILIAQRESGLPMSVGLLCYPVRTHTTARREHFELLALVLLHMLNSNVSTCPTPLEGHETVSFKKGLARTQIPTNKNDDVEFPTFGEIAGVNHSLVQWSSLALEEPPSWSWLRPLVQVSMLYPSFFKIPRMWFF